MNQLKYYLANIRNCNEDYSKYIQNRDHDGRIASNGQKVMLIVMLKVSQLWEIKLDGRIA